MRVEKRGTRYWVVLEDSSLGYPNIIHEGITKHECLSYIASHKKKNLPLKTKIPR